MLPDDKIYQQHGQTYRLIFHLLLLTAATIICYAHSIDNEWHLDDIGNIVGNQNIELKNYSYEELKKTFHGMRRRDENISRPVSYLSFALNYKTGQLKTRSYHITNIIIHLFTAFLTYLLFHKFLTINSNYNRPRMFDWRDIALLGSLLWALHPIQTQAVTYIVQRMTSLSAMFYIGSLLCYLHGRTNQNRGRAVLCFLLSLLLWILGILSKENAILLPLIIMLCEFFFFKKDLLSTKKIIHIFLFLAVFACLFMGFYIFNTRNFNVFNELLSGYKLRTFTLTERLLTEPIILLKYIFLCLAPVSDFLMLESDIVPPSSMQGYMLSAISIVAIGAMIIFSFLMRSKYPILTFTILFFFINHLVESTVLPLELYFEHRNYLPSLFIYLSVAMMGASIIQYYHMKNKTFMKQLFMVLLTAIIVSEGNATIIRNDTWKTTMSMNENNISRSPNHIRPRVSLATEYMKRNDLDKALEILGEAKNIAAAGTIKIQNNWTALIFYNQGVIYFRKKDDKKAMELLLKALKLDPSHYDTHINLAYLYYKEGKFEEAVEHYKIAVYMKPFKADQYVLLGRALIQQDKKELAEAVLKKGLTIKENFAAHLNLTSIYLSRGARELAEQEFNKLEPNDRSLDYQMFNAIFKSGESRQKSIESIIRIIITTKTDFCAWIDKVTYNNSPTTYFPSIEPILPLLRKEYIDKLSEMQDDLKRTAKEAETCDPLPVST